MAGGTINLNASPSSVLLGQSRVNPGSGSGSQGMQLLRGAEGLHGPLGGAGGYPAITISEAPVYASAAEKGAPKTKVAKGTQFTVTVMKNLMAQHSSGWIPMRFVVEDPNRMSSDGVRMLQQSLQDLSTLGYNTVPGNMAGTIDSATARAVANAVGVVAGDLKGGQNVALAVQAALNIALAKGSIDTTTQNYIRTYSKPIAIAIQVFIAKKRGQALPATGYELAPPSFWTSKNIAIGLGVGAVLVGVGYMLTKR